MGIDDLLLSPEFMKELYPETLILGPAPVPAISSGKSLQSHPSPPYVFMGKNARFICFLVSDAGHEFLPAEQLAFLNKILGACKLKPDDIALINTIHQPLEIQRLKDQFRPRIVFLWGANQPAIDANGSLPDLQVSSVDNFLVVPVRSAMTMHTEQPQTIEMKQKLWSTLKTLFVL